MKRLLALLVIPAVFFHASFQPEYIAPDYLVTQITITCSSDSPAQRQFTDQQSMGTILEYLRSAALYGKADSGAIDTDAPLYCITLTHSTGRVTVYRQIAGDFLAKDNSAWHYLDPEQGQQLQVLYHSLPGRSTI